MAISRKKISNVDLMPAVDGISRKLALVREKCYNKAIGKGGEDSNTEVVIPGHTYMGIITKDVNIIGYGTTKRVRLFMRKPMNAPVPTAQDLAKRQYFADGIKWTNAALQDLTVVTANQQKFRDAVNDLTKTIAGVSAAGYQSMRGWMSAIAIKLAAEDELPSTHALPAFDA